ncbi:hypothetical protein [Salinilacihabitans rarus]|uniref:hypothetical protein n=1 Tax=Salinilacihabitans rarus TaxID=2961596 RepID=UPI0020C85CB1|nr:hypothetical protein [Salinilacihabitans rarus]
MDVPAKREDATEPDGFEPTDAVVTCHETSPGKLVFTERHNTDGWIATDLTVDLEP